jgi:flagellar FliL protein
MSVMAEKEEKKEGEEAPKKKSKKKLIIIVVAVLLLAGGGAFFLLGGKTEEGDKTEEVEKAKVYKTAKLDPFIVNLSEAKSFLKVAILMEYDEELLHKFTGGAEGGGKGHGGGGSGGEAVAEGGFPPAMMEKEPRIKDKIISILSSKTPADVLSSTGKQALKDEVLEGINEVLEFPEPVVVALFFTEFIVQ